MTIYYIDPIAGSDANGGTGWGDAWLTYNKVRETVTLNPGDEVRFAKTPTTRSVGYANFESKQCYVTGSTYYPDTAVSGYSSTYTRRIDALTLISGWTKVGTWGGSLVSTTYANQDPRLALTFTTAGNDIAPGTKLYYKLVTGVNLSTFTDLELGEFFFYQTPAEVSQTDPTVYIKIKLCLCSDTLGDTILYSIDLDPNQLMRGFARLPTGAALPTTYGSIALYVVNTPYTTKANLSLYTLSAHETADSGSIYVGVLSKYENGRTTAYPPLPDHRVFLREPIGGAGSGVAAPNHVCPRNVEYNPYYAVRVAQGWDVTKTPRLSGTTWDYGFSGESYQTYYNAGWRWLFDFTNVQGTVGSPIKITGGYNTATGLVDGTTGITTQCRHAIDEASAARHGIPSILFNNTKHLVVENIVLIEGAYTDNTFGFINTTNPTALCAENIVFNGCNFTSGRSSIYSATYPNRADTLTFNNCVGEIVFTGTGIDTVYHNNCTIKRTVIRTPYHDVQPRYVSTNTSYWCRVANNITSSLIRQTTLPIDWALSSNLSFIMGGDIYLQNKSLISGPQTVGHNGTVFNNCNLVVSDYVGVGWEFTNITYYREVYPDNLVKPEIVVCLGTGDNRVAPISIDGITLKSAALQEPFVMVGVGGHVAGQTACPSQVTLRNFNVTGISTPYLRNVFSLRGTLLVTGRFPTTITVENLTVEKWGGGTYSVVSFPAVPGPFGLLRLINVDSLTGAIATTLPSNMINAPLSKMMVHFKNCALHDWFRMSTYGTNFPLSRQFDTGVVFEDCTGLVNMPTGAMALSPSSGLVSGAPFVFRDTVLDTERRVTPYHIIDKDSTHSTRGTHSVKSYINLNTYSKYSTSYPLCGVPVKAGVPVTVLIDVRRDSTTKNDFVLMIWPNGSNGESTSDQYMPLIASASAAAGEWETLSVSYTPLYDRMIEVSYTHYGDATSVLWFDNLRVKS